MLTFDWPYLLFLLPLPLIISFLLNLFFKKNKLLADNTQSGLKIPFYDELIKISSSKDFSNKSNLFNLKFFLKLILWASFVVALMRPLWLGEPINLPMPTHDIILAIDISGSMASTDMNDRRGQLNNPLTRLDVVKQIGHQFINQRTADKLGLVFFGSSAFVSSPLTLDQDSLHNFLEKSQIGFAGQKTAIGDAIGLAIKKIQSGHDSQNNNTSFIVLLSDGSNTSGEVNPIEAAKIAAKNNIKIYTIGIGKVSDNPLDILTGMSLDEKELKAIADTTNGQYFHADSKQSLIKIYNQINNLEPNNIENKTLRPESEWFIYPLAITLLSSVLLAVI